ncbi:MAG: T9SS type A sorting domain-containing protein [Chlorobi bacterium]|nr:T9SS type A sorting domain-containing protein [Chlorobiota bacterium]
MKTLIQYSTALMIFLILGTTLRAQITIDQNDMPSPGDTIRKSLAMNFENYDFEATGEDYTWDFSGLIPLSQSVDTFKSVSETPLIYLFFFLGYANLASPLFSDTSSFVEFPMTDVYSFYDNKSSGYYYSGFAATLYGFPVPFKYSEKDRIYSFPMNYGDMDSSSSGLAYEIPGMGYIKIQKKRVNTVDGWGTLITPYGTFEVLRLKSEVDEYDSIFLDTLNMGVPLNRQYTEYKWLTKNGKISVLEVNDDYLNFFVYYVDSIRQVSLDVPDNPGFEGPVANVYPNPVHDRFTLSLNIINSGETTIGLYDIRGVKIATLKKQYLKAGVILFSFNLNDYNLPAGKYLISIVTENGRTVKKIIFNP